MKLNGELEGWEYYAAGVFRLSYNTSSFSFVEVNLIADTAYTIDRKGNILHAVWYLITEDELIAMNKHYFKEQLEEILK